MTDPTPTTPTPTPPQGLTEAQLLELATATSNYEMCGVFAIDRANHYGINGFELIAFARAAIAAHEAARPRLTLEEVEARFFAWWAESYPHAPVGSHAVASHVAFALHLLGGEVAA